MENTYITDNLYVPGDKICYENSAKSGYGTYIRDGCIYATLLGKVKIERNSNDSQNTSKSTTDSSLPTVSIVTQSDSTVNMPTIGCIVAAKIKSVNPRFAKCVIFAVNNNVVKDSFRGQINRKDIRAIERDKVEVYKSFRCGDIILARVISLGDLNSYLLSSAENELGVVIAYSEAGHQMVPLSWNEMQCPVTKLKEYRKVAKVQPDYIKYVVKENDTDLEITNQTNDIELEDKEES